MRNTTLAIRSTGLLAAAAMGAALLAGCSGYGRSDSSMGAGASPSTAPISQTDRAVGGSPRQAAYPPQGAYGPGTVAPGGTTGPSAGQ